MPPPPGADAGALPPPDASAPPAAPGGDLLPPPAAPDAAAPSAPAPTGGDLQPPPADNLFPEGAQADVKPAKGAKHGHAGAKVSHYRVAHHDSLWKISAKSKVYGDPFQWPVLFIANRQEIKDPDLIKPGQNLKVKRDMGSEDVNSAIQKAKDTPRYEPHTTAREKLPIEY